MTCEVVLLISLILYVLLIPFSSNCNLNKMILLEESGGKESGEFSLRENKRRFRGEIHSRTDRETASDSENWDFGSHWEFSSQWEKNDFSMNSRNELAFSTIAIPVPKSHIPKSHIPLPSKSALPIDQGCGFHNRPHVTCHLIWGYTLERKTGERARNWTQSASRDHSVRHFYLPQSLELLWK